MVEEGEKEEGGGKRGVKERTWEHNGTAHGDKEQLIELELPSIVNDQIAVRQRVL